MLAEPVFGRKWMIDSAAGRLSCRAWAGADRNWGPSRLDGEASRRVDVRDGLHASHLAASARPRGRRSSGGFRFALSPASGNSPSRFRPDAIACRPGRAAIGPWTAPQDHFTFRRHRCAAALESRSGRMPPFPWRSIPEALFRNASGTGTRPSSSREKRKAGAAGPPSPSRAKGCRPAGTRLEPSA